MTGTDSATGHSPKTRYISFYSYKGGTGRTLALANCARALAQMGKTVAIVDLDLEAPGLTHFAAFRPAGEPATGKGRPLPALTGFAEYLADCVRDGPPARLTRYFHPCAGAPGDRGRVYLMPAGRRDDPAYRDILTFDWGRFYAEQDGYRLMENLRGHIAHNLGEDEAAPIRPEYVLIDARTGLSETGGIATHQLADLVVLLFALNHQNLDGTRWVHDSLAALPDPPRMLLVISPLPEVLETGKGTLYDERLAFIRKRLGKAVNHQRPAVLPYRPVLAWEERILVDSEEPEYLGYDQPYRALLTGILELFQDPEVFLDRAMKGLRANREDDAREALATGLKANPDDPALLEASARLGAEREPRIDLARLPAGAGHFLGRAAELAALDAVWAEGSGVAILALVGLGGVGKTALVKHWLAGLRARGWDGAARVFGWSFYNQVARSESGDDRQASDEHFLAAALDWFGVQIAASAHPADKGLALAEVIAARRTLLVLDGCELLQHPPGPLAGELRAPGLKALLTRLAAAGQPGLCVVTSRERLADLAEWVRGEDQPQGPLVRLDLGNLTDSDGARLLHRLGANRAGAAAIDPDDPELIAASRAVAGHALSLALLGRYLARAHGGDIRRLDGIDPIRADRDARGQAARVVAAYEQWLASAGRDRELAALRLFGFFDRPAHPALLDALRAGPVIPGLTEPLRGLDAADWNTLLASLADARLVRIDADRIDAHPLVREHLAERLRTEHPTAWREGHRRLHDWLTASAPHRPDGLVGLQPLYQAVVHGCQAGLWEAALQEVFVDRILRGTGADGFYSALRLGAFGADLGALGGFFAEPWSRPVSALSEAARSWLLNQVAFNLRALGRLAEALGPMRAAAELRVEQQDWRYAAIGYGNLSELGLLLGRISDAVADARRAIEYADRGGDTFQRMVARTTLGEALHQQGATDAAGAFFVEAEAMQAAVQAEYPLLSSRPGARYGDLLLAGAERAAWSSGTAATLEEAQADCAMSAWRARRTLEWTGHPGASLLDVAWARLLLARCALYSDLLQSRPPGDEAQDQAARALDGLRAAGQLDELPRGLLTRAWLRHTLGDPDGAEAALDEAERIASRGAMALSLADCALYRARLFQDRAALAEARRLIDTHGYGRRLPELQDAEAAAVHWSPPSPERPRGAPHA
jgi:hypothetical protein